MSLFFCSLFLLLLLPASAWSAPFSQYVVVTIPPATTWFSLTDYPSGLVSGITFYGLTDVPNIDRPVFSADTSCGTSYIGVSTVDIGFSYTTGGSCTNVRIVNESEEYSYDIAIAGPDPTPTVEPTPTLTPTLTPTSEVIITATPVPTPTPDYPALAYQLQQDNTQLSIFTAAGVLGLLILLLFLRR